MQIQLVVTQHQTLVELLRERRIIDKTTPVIDHARPDDILGMHVLGVLPHHLSSLAASYTEVPIRFADAAERRSFAGGDIPLERLRQIADKPVTYVVLRTSGRVAAVWPRALDWARGPNGFAVKFLSNDHCALLEVADVDGHRSAHVDLYRGAWRQLEHGARGQWLDPLTNRPWKVLVSLGDGRTREVGEYPTEIADRLIAGEAYNPAW